MVKNKFLLFGLILTMGLNSFAEELPEPTSVSEENNDEQIFEGFLESFRKHPVLKKDIIKFLKERNLSCNPHTIEGFDEFAQAFEKKSPVFANYLSEEPGDFEPVAAIVGFFSTVATLSTKHGMNPTKIAKVLR
jgi:hypothetical protein